jgi:hypothetical protein
MKKSSYRNLFSSRRGWPYICLVDSKNLNVKFAITAKLESFWAKCFWIHTSQCPITSLNSSCNQKSEIDKPYRAGSQNLLIKAFFNMINFRFFTPVVKRRNFKVTYETAPVAVLDALSNDTNPAQNGRLGAEIWLIYWKNVELENSGKWCEWTILLSIFENFASTLKQMFLYEKMRHFTLYNNI